MSRGEPLADGKRLGPAPAADRPVLEIRAFVERAYGLPAGYRVGEVRRHGGRDDSTLTVEILPPGDGRALVIRYDEERLCRNAETLRGHAARDTNGLTRGDLIVGKGAPAVYEALCTLAAVYDREDPCDLTHEWIQCLRSAGERLTGHTLDREGRYAALSALQRWPYARGLVLAAQAAQARGDPFSTPHPPILVVDPKHGGGEYVTNRHLGVFVRHEMGAEKTTDSKAAGRVIEIGGSRHSLQAWNVDRNDKKRLVLIRLPDPPEPPPEDGEDADEGEEDGDEA